MNFAKVFNLDFGYFCFFYLFIYISGKAELVVRPNSKPLSRVSVK